MDWVRGTVTEILSNRGELQEIMTLLDDGTAENAVHYTDRLRALEIGDIVLLNTAALALQLNSGGYHLVVDIIGERVARSTSTRAEGHIMKFRYTPLQRAVLSVEEEASPYHPIFLEHRTLEGLPVLIGELHSMLPIALCWLQHRSLNGSGKTDKPRISYLMSDAAALPLAWSRHVSNLKQLGWLESTITCGQAYGGKLEAVNKFSALQAAKHVENADICIVAMGPGIAGTGTPLGHSAMEIGEWVNAVHSMEGLPIVIPRISFADPRDRHRGISHHTIAALKTAALAGAFVPLPSLPIQEQHDFVMEQWYKEGFGLKHSLILIPHVGLEEVEAAMKLYPEPITSMGRGLHNDPSFFLGVCSAAESAWMRCV